MKTYEIIEGLKEIIKRLENDLEENSFLSDDIKNSVRNNIEKHKKALSILE